ncbi:MAG: hypothetical protein Kow0031_32550 [Anaerolineae bacterium]
MNGLVKFSPVALLFVIIAGGVMLAGSFLVAPAQATELRPPAGERPLLLAQGSTCSCSANTFDCRSFVSREEAQFCFDQCLSLAGYDVHDLDIDGDGQACETTAYSIIPGLEPGTRQTPPPPQPANLPEIVPGANNKVYNGNFEYGFYQVPQLGFEPGDVGNIPFYWGWYKSNTFGKVTIDNNQGYGIVCPDDVGAAAAFELRPADTVDDMFGPIPGVNPFQRPNNSLSMHMQSTDQPDMPLGVYQTVNVVPGQDYRFSMSGTIQVQKGGTTLQPRDPEAPREAQNHTIEVYFDPSGGTDWQAIPLEKRHVVQFEEHELEFSGEDPALATVQDYETVVRARSDKLTIFITAWRKWANWRTSLFVVDCVTLEPVGVGAAAVAPPPPPPSDEAQPAAVVKPSAVEPVTEGQPTEVQIIPPSDGILDTGQGSLLTVIFAVVLVGGLVGAGIWNMRRR